MSQWTCAHCGLPSSFQGHYMRPIGDMKICPKTTPETYKGELIGFCCPPNHVCKPETKQ